MLSRSRVLSVPNSHYSVSGTNIGFLEKVGLGIQNVFMCRGWEVFALWRFICIKASPSRWSLVTELIPDKISEPIVKLFNMAPRSRVQQRWPQGMIYEEKYLCYDNIFVFYGWCFIEFHGQGTSLIQVWKIWQLSLCAVLVFSLKATRSYGKNKFCNKRSKNSLKTKHFFTSRSCGVRLCEERSFDFVQGETDFYVWISCGY